MVTLNRQRKGKRASKLAQVTPEFKQAAAFAALGTDPNGSAQPSWFCSCGHLKLAHYRITNTKGVETHPSYCTAVTGIKGNPDGSPSNVLKRCGCRHDFSDELGRAA